MLTATPIHKRAGSSSIPVCHGATSHPRCCTRQARDLARRGAGREYQRHRRIKETEAEATAYVVAGLLGPGSSPTSVSHLSGWSGGDADKVRNTAARVLRAVRILSDGLIGEEAEHGRGTPQNSTRAAGWGDGSRVGGLV